MLLLLLLLLLQLLLRLLLPATAATAIATATATATAAVTAGPQYGGFLLHQVESQDVPPGNRWGHWRAAASATPPARFGQPPRG